MDSFIILQCPSLSLVIFFILKSTLSNIYIAFLKLAKKKNQIVIGDNYQEKALSHIVVDTHDNKAF